MQRIMRRIEIDMGHRVTNHKGQCRNPHGHRYCIEAYVEGMLQTSGSSEGMVVDFGIVKEVMVESIHKHFDHGFALWKGDALVEALGLNVSTGILYYSEKLAAFKSSSPLCGKAAIMSCIPTAENLASLWGQMIKLPLSEHGVTLLKLRVWETPNSFAEACFASPRS